MIDTILFDLDGTIIDSEPAALQAILDCTGAWGVPVTKEDAATVAGKKWEVAFDLLYRKHKMPLPVEAASRAIVARFQEIVHAELKVVPGSVEAIKDFAGHFRLAVVSGSMREDIFWALNKLDIIHHFQFILGAEDYPNSKPAPDGYLKAIQLLGADPKKTLIFEDSAAGIASAQAAGAKVVAITSTNHYGHDQSTANAHIEDFRGVAAGWVRAKFG
jgi:HAD superfamily hydrolase (TIGR01509 family)